MRIALITYECMKETGGGGIGTYISHILPALNDYGHKAVVITGTYRSEAFWENASIYRIPAKGADDFNNQLLKYFPQLHKEIQFDVVEATDFKAWGLPVKKQFPQLPFVVKLHTPNFLIDLLQYKEMTFLEKARFVLGGIKRGKVSRLPGRPTPQTYQQEFEILRKADRLAATTNSIARKLRAIGMIENPEIDLVPCCLPVSENMLKIEARKVLKNPQIIFIGRLEVRKGVIELAKAIPLVLKKFPDAHFTFVGATTGSPKKGMDMIEYLKEITKKHHPHVHFTGKVPFEKVESFLDKGDLFVFPSHYESFGLVCCEALAAGKAVIGSKNGGMVEILENGRCGLLTSPDPLEISQHIICLLQNDAMRVELGTKGRERVLSFYSPGNIMAMQIKSYENAIRNKVHSFN